MHSVSVGRVGYRALEARHPYVHLSKKTKREHKIRSPCRTTQVALTYIFNGQSRPFASVWGQASATGSVRSTSLLLTGVQIPATVRAVRPENYVSLWTWHGKDYEVR